MLIVFSWLRRVVCSTVVLIFSSSVLVTPAFAEVAQWAGDQAGGGGCSEIRHVDSLINSSVGCYRASNNVLAERPCLAIADSQIRSDWQGPWLINKSRDQVSCLNNAFDNDVGRQFFRRFAIESESTRSFIWDYITLDSEHVNGWIAEYDGPELITLGLLTTGAVGF